ncbi:MAG: family 43 glycosylhydrolase [Spirosomataceae bacterium]
MKYKNLLLFWGILLWGWESFSQLPTMYYGDTSRVGRPYSKDPHVVKFKGKYLMYFSIPPSQKLDGPRGWGIGIAQSNDLVHWYKIGEITPKAGEDYEKNGLCAPGAMVEDNKIHLFYQTYGNGRKDAICHAWSSDGVHFERNPTNPIFSPTGNWNCGRAIDAEVIRFKDKYLLYFATRDPTYKIQELGVAEAPLHTRFNREDWKLLSTEGPILKPELPWEGECIEGASIVRRGDELVMFYAGAYNNWPQQVGVAHSHDGVHWERIQNEPFLANGNANAWNSSESGHPHIFEDTDGKTYLFFQGNNDKGKTWYLSYIKVKWKGIKPQIVK